MKFEPGLLVLGAMLLGGFALMNIARSERPGEALGEVLQGLLVVGFLVAVFATLVRGGWKLLVWVWS